MEVDMSPKVPKAYLDARRAEILEAAAKCFMEKGFHNTTMQDIYRATNLSPGAVYNYFGSKEDIVFAAIEMSQERNSTMIESAALGNPDQALARVGQVFLYFAKQTDLTKAAGIDFALYSEAGHNARIREALRAGQDTVMAKIVDGQKLLVFVQKVFASFGLSQQDAYVCSDNLVLADLRGIPSHGVARLKRYVDGMKTVRLCLTPNRTLSSRPLPRRPSTQRRARTGDQALGENWNLCPRRKGFLSLLLKISTTSIRSV
jgi:AcrR family transcriptional regulator